jgi:hypothetical protein
LPLPDEGTKFSKNSVIEKYVIFCLYDKLKNTFIGNSITVKAEMNDNSDGEWVFQYKDDKFKEENCIYVKVDGYGIQQSNWVLIAEFVLYVVLPGGKKGTEVSSCFA